MSFEIRLVGTAKCPFCKALYDHLQLELSKRQLYIPVIYCEDEWYRRDLSPPDEIYIVDLESWSVKRVEKLPNIVVEELRSIVPRVIVDMYLWGSRIRFYILPSGTRGGTIENVAKTIVDVIHVLYYQIFKR